MAMGRPARGVTVKTSSGVAETIKTLLQPLRKLHPALGPETQTLTGLRVFPPKVGRIWPHLAAWHIANIAPGTGGFPRLDRGIPGFITSAREVQTDPL